MQDFYNLSFDMVKKFADAYGLYVEEVYAFDPYIPKGQVIQQDPLSGTPLTMGDTIQVVISKGKEEASQSTVNQTVMIDYVAKYAENDFNQTKPLANKIQVFIGDAKHNINELAQEYEITESQELTLTFEINEGGKGQYRILRDGEVIAESSAVYPDQ